MAFYDEKLRIFRDKLNARGYEVRLANAAVTDALAAPVTVHFPKFVLGEQSLIAIPDVHISDGSDGDIFLNGDPTNVTRFAATLEAIDDFLDVESSRAFALQLGDWYDVWRAIGADTNESRFSKIENVPAYQRLLELDAKLSLAHLIGNHDASFTHALPDRRVAQGERFRFGFGLMNSKGRVFSLHGHQTDHVEGVPSPENEQRAVWLGTLAARYLTSEARSLQHFLDAEGADLGSVFNWLKSLVGVNRPDPTPNPRGRKPAPSGGILGSFIDREDTDLLVKIAVNACKKRYGTPQELELLIVGHSHKPCIAWAPHPDTKRPVVVVDAGSWVYGDAQLLFGAGDRLTVFDIVKRAN